MPFLAWPRMPGSKQMPSSPHRAAAHLVHTHAQRPSKHSKLHPAHACRQLRKSPINQAQLAASTLHVKSGLPGLLTLFRLYTPLFAIKKNEKGISWEIIELLVATDVGFFSGPILVQFWSKALSWGEVPWDLLEVQGLTPWFMSWIWAVKIVKWTNYNELLWLRIWLKPHIQCLLLESTFPDCRTASVRRKSYVPSISKHTHQMGVSVQQLNNNALAHLARSNTIKQ